MSPSRRLSGVGVPNGDGAHRAPSACPVCGADLSVTRLGCVSCGTEIGGVFRACEFCALEQGELDTLRVFLASRGNLREVERHLGVSYPTARVRFTDILVKLGLADEPDADAGVEVGHGTGSTDGPGAAEQPDRVQILADVAAGRLTPDRAAGLLAAG